jgi:PAS domain S-box-containing protein
VVSPGPARPPTIERGVTPPRGGAATLRSFPGWVVVEQSEAIALAPIRDRTIARTAVIVGMLAMIVLVVVLAGRRLLMPLRLLADAVERIGAGERVRVDVRASGEVAVLADGIDRMARSLEQREDELRTAEATTRRSEERLRLMVEGVEDYAIFLLRADATIWTWNSGARKLFDADAGQVLGRPMSELFASEQPPPDLLDTARRTGRSEGEGWCRRSDSSRFWAAVAVAHLEDDDGDTYGFAVVLHDLTERREAREAMQAALEREQQAAQELRRTNALKDEFLAIAAHEIRTPLSVILGAVRLLGADDDTPEEQADEIRTMIEAHAEDLHVIVERLLDFTRLQAGKVHLSAEPLQLCEELSAHVRSLGHHLDDHDIILDVDPVELVTDGVALRHVVTNLLSNAAKFSPAGSTITVTGHRDTSEVRITVADEGLGVGADDQERIFELFRHASRDVVTARGAGVGLAIVKRYVELLGGQIHLASVPGEGSTFTVTLPADRPAAG